MFLTQSGGFIIKPISRLLGAILSLIYRGLNEIGVESTLWIVDNPEVVDWAVKHNVGFISSNFPDRIKAYLDALRTVETARNGACNLIR